MSEIAFLTYLHTYENVDISGFGILLRQRSGYGGCEILLLNHQDVLCMYTEF